MSERGAQALGDVLEGAGEIAGLVERVDQGARDHAIDGLGEHDHRLPGEVLAQGDRRGDVGLDVGRAVLAAAAARHPRPGGRREALAFVLRRALQRRRGAVGIEGVVDLGAEILRERRRIGFERLGGPVAGLDGVRGGSGSAASPGTSTAGASSARSSRGLRSSSLSMKAASSALGICRSLIACNSCGVSTIDWP